MLLAAKDNGLKTEIRNRIDGGLNLRSNPWNVREDECILLNNFQLLEDGSIGQRKAMTTQMQTTWAGTGNLPAPVLTEVVGGGTLAAGTYSIRYFLTVYNKTATGAFYFSPSAAASITVGANAAITIDIKPNNLGEQVGQTSAGADDPFNGGTWGPRNTAGGAPYALVKLSTDPNYTLQALSGSLWDWNQAALARRATLTAYAVGATLADADGNFPLRHIAWHPGIQQLIGWTVDRAGAFDSAFTTTFTRFAIAKDKNNADHFWSRLPTRIKTLLVDDYMLAWDGIGRPKVLHWTGSVATSHWRLIGANVPAAPAAPADGGAGALGAGVYQYKFTITYRKTAGNIALSTEDIESNASSAVSINLGANRQITVNLPTSSESGALNVNIYRTAVGGSTYRRVATAAIGTATYTDNNTDTSIAGNVQPPDATGFTGNDMPPALDHLVLFRGRCWGVKTAYSLDSSGRIIALVGTNEVYFTKPVRDLDGITYSENIDAWPYSIRVGDANPVLGMVAARGRVYVFKAQSVHVITGSGPDDVDQEELFADVGAMRDSIVAIGAEIFFWDPEKGPVKMDGASWDHIGFKVQDGRTLSGPAGWLTDRAAGYVPWAAYYSRQQHEVRWVLSTLTSYVAGNVFSSPMDSTANVKEYVYYRPDDGRPGRWLNNTNGQTDVSGICRRRLINSVALAPRTTALFSSGVYTLFAANANGALLRLDDGFNWNQGDVESTCDVVFRFFLGDEWDMVKDDMFLYIWADLPFANGASSISVYVGMLSGTSGSNKGQTVYLVTSGTFTGSTGAAYDQVYKLKIPKQLITKASGTGKLTVDRALIVEITGAGDTAGFGSTDGLRIKGIALKYKDVSDIRGAV